MTKAVSDQDDPVIIIEQEALAVAFLFGASDPRKVATSLVERILVRLGGAHVYLPRRTSRERKRIHAEIVQRFNGRNLFELAQEFELSPRHLRRIISSAVSVEAVKQVTDREKSDRQTYRAV